MTRKADALKGIRAALDAMEISLLSTSDEEILQEMGEESGSAEVEASQTRAVLQRAIADFKRKQVDVGQMRLKAARGHFQQRTEELQKKKVDLPTSPEEQRDLLAKVFIHMPQMFARGFTAQALTAQHRELEEFTDKDVESFLRQLYMLGVLDDLLKDQETD